MRFNLWSKVCSLVNKTLEKWFSKLGHFVSSHPYIIISVTIVVSLLLMCGFGRFHVLNRIESLYIPQHSQSMINLKRGNQHFLLSTRVEEFIIKYKTNDSALTNELFYFLNDIHTSIMKVGCLGEVCITDRFQNCITLSPAELLHNLYLTKRNISERINRIYNNNDTLFLNNGRPAIYSYPIFFGHMSIENNNGSLSVDAKSIRVQYFLKYPNDDNGALYKKELDCELEFLSVMRSYKRQLQSKEIDLLYMAGRSTSDSVLESSEKDIKLVSVSLILMIIFCTLTMAKFQDKVNGHFLLGLGGIGTLMLGIGAAFGSVILIGIPFIGFAGVLPFLVIGVGIDNIFIITHCFDRQDINKPTCERISKTMSQVGASITMTTLTDLVAFGVSMVTDFPAIKYFCLYVAIGITFSYILVITLFLGLLIVDANRILGERIDFLPCMLASNQTRTDTTQVTEAIMTKILTKYGAFLMKLPTRCFVIIFSISLLALSIYAALHLDQSFDPLDLGLEGTEFGDFFKYKNKAFSKSFEISVILDTPVDYTDTKIQVEYAKLSNIAKENPFIKNITFNWMESYLIWLQERNRTISKNLFYPNLKEFLATNKHFYPDLKFNKSGKISVSRMVMFSSENDDSMQRKIEMLSLRNVLKKKTSLPVYVAALPNIYTEQFVIMLRDTIRNLAFSSGAILIITLPYLESIVVTFFVFFGFLSLIVELLGIMVIWNVSLNSISMIIIVMAIGFAVDYSAHIAHAYMVSKEITNQKRAIDALRTMGSSVLMGGTSTIIGILVTAFASSEIFRIFFKMMFSIVVLGLLHGLVFLPVLLATFCNRQADKIEERKVHSFEKNIDDDGENNNMTLNETDK